MVIQRDKENIIGQMVIFMKLIYCNQGQWKKNKINGYGIKKYANGNRYEVKLVNQGEWKDSQYTHGKFFYKNGDTYEVFFIFKGLIRK